MTRYLGLDIGTKTVGIAISDPLKLIANGLVTIKRTNVKQDIDEIKDIIQKNDIEKLIVGMPYTTDGKIESQAQRVLSFVDLLKREVDIDIEYIDERFTTISAERVLINQKVRRENRKEHIDKIAASLILQSYLDKNKI